MHKNTRRNAHTRSQLTPDVEVDQFTEGSADRVLRHTLVFAGVSGSRSADLEAVCGHTHNTLLVNKYRYFIRENGLYNLLCNILNVAR